ncbi:MAG: radical SAM protein, partial [Desulfatiglandales bacterium]
MVNYLRLSVTDRCNLRCIYCVPREGLPLVDHSQILTYEEMLRLVRIVVQMEIKKVRITGGEPLLRKGIVWFIGELNSIEGLEKITLT